MKATCAVTMDVILLQELDVFCKVIGVNRSQVVAGAVRDYISKGVKDVTGRDIDKGGFPR